MINGRERERCASAKLEIERPDASKRQLLVDRQAKHCQNGFLCERLHRQVSLREDNARSICLLIIIRRFDLI